MRVLSKDSRRPARHRLHARTPPGAATPAGSPSSPLDPTQFGADQETIRLALEAENIEARPVWKPMHLQPVFAPLTPQFWGELRCSPSIGGWGAGRGRRGGGRAVRAWALSTFRLQFERSGPGPGGGGDPAGAGSD